MVVVLLWSFATGDRHLTIARNGALHVIDHDTQHRLADCALKFCPCTCAKLSRARAARIYSGPFSAFMVDVSGAK